MIKSRLTPLIPPGRTATPDRKWPDIIRPTKSAPPNDCELKSPLKDIPNLLTKSQLGPLPLSYRAPKLTNLLILGTALLGCQLLISCGDDFDCTVLKSCPRSVNDQSTEIVSDKPPTLKSTRLTDAEFQLLLPLADDYMAPSADELLEVESIVAASTVLESPSQKLNFFLERLASLDVKKNHPKMSGFVVRNFESNAEAAFGSIILYSGLAKLNLDTVSAAVCHEISHNLRSHASKKRANWNRLDKNLPVITWVNRFDRYLTQAINTNGDYSHDHSRFQELRDTAPQSLVDFFQQGKKFEHEADLVGSMVCGSIGIAPKQFRAGLSKLFSSRKSQIKPTNPPSQVIKSLGNREEITRLLFHLMGYGSHPSDQDRMNELIHFENQTTVHSLALDLEAESRWVDTVRSLNPAVADTSPSFGLTEASDLRTTPPSAEDSNEISLIEIIRTL